MYPQRSQSYFIPTASHEHHEHIVTLCYFQLSQFYPYSISTEYPINLGICLPYPVDSSAMRKLSAKLPEVLGEHSSSFTCLRKTEPWPPTGIMVQEHPKMTELFSFVNSDDLRIFTLC